MQHTIGPKVSTLVKDANLDMGTFSVITPLVQADHITEKTGAHGVQLNKVVKGYAKLTASDNILQGWTPSLTEFLNSGAATKMALPVFYCDPAIYGYGGTVRVKATIGGTTFNVCVLIGNTEVVKWTTSGAKTQDCTVVSGDTVWMEFNSITGTCYAQSASVCADVAAGP